MVKFDNESSDEDLMLLYQQGSEAAFWQLYHRYRQRVYGFLLSRVRQQDRAEDLFQISFLKLHQYRHRYRHPLPLAPWLFTIARNVWKDYLREMQTDQQLDQYVDSPSPWQQAELPSVDLKSLTPDQREALIMRFGTDCSYQEISEKLGKSAGNIRQLISRAIRRLRGTLT